MDKIGVLSQGKYELKDRSFKDLDPYDFPYQSDSDREAAVKNAIKAFDRLRMPKDDPTWQILLPESDRGKGICLSRLKINAPPQPTPMPSLKLNKKADKKETASKKNDTKKAVPTEDAGKTKREKKGAVNEETGKSVKGPEKQPMRRMKKAEGSATVPAAGAKDVKNTPVAKKTVPGATSTVQRGTKQKPKAGTAEKSSTTSYVSKPKTPSPLSASPVNAADFGEDHPVHKALSGAPSPAKSLTGSDRPLKRKADFDNHLATKQRKLDAPDRTSINGFRPSSSTPSSAEKKRKADPLDSDTASTPSSANKSRRLEPINTSAPRSSSANRPTNGAVNGQRSDNSSMDDSSPTSPPLPLTFRQTIELSQKFNIYYEKYYKLHIQLSISKDPPTKQQREELWKMHKMLESMKEEIRIGALQH
jgi:RNA polymerase II elongation factor ELL